MPDDLGYARRSKGFRELVDNATGLCVAIMDADTGQTTYFKNPRQLQFTHRSITTEK
jgi:hypothetical protein